MQGDILYINEVQADITGVDISQNLQVNDLFEVSGRQSSYTDTATLPKTEKNIALFNGLGIPTNVSNTPYRLQKVTYLRKGIEMFSNANGIVRTTAEGFKVNFYFNNNALFDIIESKNLSDLSISEFNHDLTREEYTARLTGDNFYYPLANYGGQTDSEIIFDYQTPVIKTKFLWNKIFSEAGFTYRYKGRGGRNDYNPFLTDVWNDSVITLDKGFNPEDQSVPPEDVYIGNRTEAENQTNVVLPFELIRNIRFNSTESDLNRIIPQTLSGRTSFVVQESGYYRIDINGDFLGNQIQEASLRLISSDGVLEDIQEFDEGTNELAFEERFYFREGQVFYFQLLFTNEETPGNLQYSFDFNLDIKLDNQDIRVNLSQYLNKISQKNFIKDVANYFGLLFVNKGDLYEFISYQELFNIFAKYSNFNSLKPKNFVFEDWTDKFSELIEESYNIGDYGRKNFFRYQYDNENSNFADAVLEIDNETLQGEKTLVQRIFKAPDNSRIRVDNRQLLRMNLYEIDEEQVKPKSSTPYILTPQKVNGSFQYKKVGGQAFTYTGDYYVAKFQNLSWQNSTTRFNSGLINILNRQNIIKARIALDEYDVQNIDFFKLKYIDQLGAMYYLNKISNFKNQETTTVELIKVLPLEQQGAFSDDFSDDFDT